MRQNDKIAVEKWEQYRKNLVKSTPVAKETEKEQIDRIKRLEKNPNEWKKYYFPHYCDAEFAPFQNRASKKIINNNVIYVVKAWAREHAKSSTSEMDELYLLMTGKIHNMLIVSHSFDNAVSLCMPLIIVLESNQRLINDYGVQKSFGTWDMSKGKWVTANNCNIRAVGLKQSPRGTKNEEKRPDYIRVDDGDNDEMVRNESRVKDAWNWVEQALIPCLSISGSKRIVFAGNIIGSDTIITRAIEMSDFHEKVNILDQNGKPSWDRYTLEQVNYMLSKISYFSGQKEYFNNPIIEGLVFEDIYEKGLQKVGKYRFLLVYIDPSFKDSKKNDFKAAALIGRYKKEFHVHKAFCEQTTTLNLAKGLIAMYEYVNDKVPIYWYMESNTTQDDILKKVNEHLYNLKAGFRINGDEEKKGDKFSRIESTLEPINRAGELWFNIEEKDNPHMQRAKQQMKAIAPHLPAHDDFPDALQGAVRMYNKKTVAMTPPTTGSRSKGVKKF